MTAIVDRLNQISEPPTQKAEFDSWLEMGNALAFLRDNDQEDEFVLCASDRCSFVHAIAVPASSVTPPDIDDLMGWSCGPHSSWGITVRFSEPSSVWISPPLDHTRSKTLDLGEQLVFARKFDGRPGNCAERRAVEPGLGEDAERRRHVVQARLHSLRKVPGLIAAEPVGHTRRAQPLVDCDGLLPVGAAHAARAQRHRNWRHGRLGAALNDPRRSMAMGRMPSGGTWRMRSSAALPLVDRDARLPVHAARAQRRRNWRHSRPVPVLNDPR